MADAAATTSLPAMSNRDFTRVSQFVREEYGINLTDAKKVMVETRLRKRLQHSNCDGYDAYVEHLFTDEGRRAELPRMIDLITTNTTDFFREPQHFSFLVERALPELRTQRPSRRDPLRVWSAACSTGEEPYTLAMLLESFAEQNRSFDYEIVGTDLSSQALDVARQGIYSEEKVVTVPAALRRKYLRRGTGSYAGMVRMVPGLRQRVGLSRINLVNSRSASLGTFDIAFLRNVIIYFDRATKVSVVSQVVDRLRPGGLLFVGHSETLFGMQLPLRLVQPTVYRKTDGGKP